MKLVALISGGKDSCFNMLQCIAAGHEIVALAHLKPKGQIEEMDSHMYQSVGHDAIEYFAKAVNLPLYQEEIGGGHLSTGKDYTETVGDEVEDLFSLLQKVQEKETIEGVAVGAVLSDYQRVRVENVCSRLGLTAFAYLWRRNQAALLSEMIASDVHAIIVKVATLGLTPEHHLGKCISEIFPHFMKLENQYGMNVCGEGGEYETFTLDCPLFKERIVIEEQAAVNHALDAFAPVAYLKFKRLRLEPKSRPSTLSQQEIIEEHGICKPGYFLYGLGIDYEAPFTPNSILDGSETIRNIPSWEQASNRNHSCGITTSGSGWFWVTSCMALSRADPAEEMQLALQSLENVLTANGLAMSDLVSVQLLVKDMHEFAVLNKSYKAFFDLNPPSRVCVEVPLPDDVNFLIHCTGFKGSEQHCDDKETVIKHMHVQSVSHWAPANIGPYSQAVQVGNFLYVSGQIGLVPSTMLMIGGGIVQESRLALRHVHRVLEAMDASCSLKNALVCVGYVTHRTLIASAREEWNKAIGESERARDLTLNCVIVPALPRDACIEWQVIAHCQQSQSWDWSKPDVDLIDDISVNCTLGWFKSEGVLIAQCFRTEDVSLVQENAVVGTLSHLTKLMTALADSKAVCHFQVYYTITDVNWNTLENAWKKLNLENGSLSLTPVLGNETDNCIMVIFGRVVRKGEEKKSAQIIESVLSNLREPPCYTTVRVNTLLTTSEKALTDLRSYIPTYNVVAHPSLPDLLIISPVATEAAGVIPVAKEVIVDLRCGTSVLRGADVYIPGVVGAPHDLQEGDCVAAFADVEGKCLKGAIAKFAGQKSFLGNGIMQISRNDLFKQKIARGVAVKMSEPIYRSPCLDNILPSQLFLQNLPSVVCSHVVDPQPGDMILDMCAAPGGKTTHLAILMKNQGTIIALDKTKPKITKINRNAELCKVTCVKTFVFDARHAWDPKSEICDGPPYPSKTFDRILLDAPCSALGQRPQLSNKMTVKELQSYPKLQKQLLANAVELLKEGGILVYSTCTFTLQENELLVKWFLCKYPIMQLEEQVPYLGHCGLLGANLSDKELGMVQRFGYNAEVDIARAAVDDTSVDKDTIGFFIAKFRKSCQ